MLRKALWEGRCGFPYRTPQPAAVSGFVRYAGGTAIENVRITLVVPGSREARTTPTLAARGESRGGIRPAMHPRSRVALDRSSHSQVEVVAKQRA
jgi:hypothetical protein